GAQHLAWEITLKRQIVDREYGGRLGAPLDPQQEWDEPGMPVVCMHHVGLPVQDTTGGDFRSHARKESEPQRIVDPVLAVVVLVQPTSPREETRRVNEPYRHVRIGKAA